MKEITPSQSIDIGKNWKQGVLPGYENEVANLLTAKKFEELKEFFTNPYGRVTAVKQNPRDITSAVLTARLSRAGQRDVTELFWNEFRTKTGETVADKILNEFGDDSVREDASGYLFIRDVSVLTSMQAFRHPLITGIEASTRYINWGDLPIEDFAVLPEKISDDPEAKEIYLRAVNDTWQTYKNLWPQVWDHVTKSTPREEDQPEAAYKKAVKGAVCDALRGLLPLGTKTNFAIHANYRALSELIMNLRASDLTETRDVANEMAVELKKVNPVFIGVVDSDHGTEWVQHQNKTNKTLKKFGEGGKGRSNGENLNVAVEILNGSWSKDVLREALVSKNGNLVGYGEQELAEEFLPNGALRKLLKDLGNARTNRRHKLPDVVNSAVVRIKVENLSFGAFKDLNRHRPLLFKSEPDWSGRRGYVIPDIIRKIGGKVEASYRLTQEGLLLSKKKLEEKFPEESKLLLSHGTKTAYEFISGLAEAFWIVEIRSGQSGNPEYREIAIEAYKGIIEASAAFQDLGHFVDEKKYELGRIQEAVRTELKEK
ncbi:MAG TPA: FAD-dependent thymidylate synthase [Patescibacteria group bacterium]|nr:FAD-dependent thymidylate synthase [Patescibacteria group bacterium]